MRITQVLQASRRSNTIGFIGIGAMGSEMFRNLVRRSASTTKKKHEFVVFDVNKSVVSKILHEFEDTPFEVRAASSPKDLAVQASTILSMIPTSKHVQDVYLGESSIIQGLKELDQSSVSETLCLDSSTIEQSITKSVGMEMRAAGADMMDAPVSGGVVGAQKGTLTIMVGGDPTTFTKAEPILQSMSSKVTLCGGLGAGLLLGITMVGLSEAMLLGKNLGLDSQVLANIIDKSTGHCWSNEINNPVPTVTVNGSSPPAHRQYSGGFVSKLTHKDLALAVEAARSTGTPLQLGGLTERMYRPLARSDDWESLDFSAIYKYLEEVGAPIGSEIL
ncbi:3-hydroxyisobutyrate dehydrogenase [Sarocladium strictum]